MTINTTTTRVSYTGDGVTTAFAVPFAFFGASELEVISRVIATGVETVLALTTNYTVSGGNGSTGTVTAVVAPAATVQWVIRRKTARTQLVDYTPNDPFPAETHERALDRLTALVQEIGEESDRSLKYPKTDSTGISTTLPSSVARANKIAAYDASGAPAVFELATLGAITLPLSVAQGGTGATNAAAALTALGAEPSALNHGYLDQSQSWTAGQTPLTATLTDAATVNWDMSAAQVGAVTCAAARTFAAPSNQVANRFYALSITNSGGAWAHAFNAAFVFDSNDGTPGSFPSGSRLHLIFRSDGTNLREWGRRQVAS